MLFLDISDDSDTYSQAQNSKRPRLEERLVENMNIKVEKDLVKVEKNIRQLSLVPGPSSLH